MKISDYIPTGRDNALPMRTLAILAGVEERTARSMVHKARTQGEPICSVCCGGKCGYYMPRNIEEAKVYLRQQNARLKSLRAALRGVKQFIFNAIRGQDDEH